MQASIAELEAVLGFPWHARSSVCVRLDGGFGTDDNVDWLLRKGYQVVIKGLSGSRAGSWGKRIVQWDPIEPDRRWVALPPQQLQFCRPTRTVAVRWCDAKGELKHALYIITDMQLSLPDLARLYDLRTRLEVEFRQDKQGLLLATRRKHHWEAQETLALLTDLAHNFLGMFRRQVLTGTPLANYGLYRLTREVLNVPGRVQLDPNGYLQNFQLNAAHPHASILAAALPRLFDP